MKLTVEGDSLLEQKPVFCHFIYIKKTNKTQKINENKMLKGQHFQQNKLYKIGNL